MKYAAVLFQAAAIASLFAGVAAAPQGLGTSHVCTLTGGVSLTVNLTLVPDVAAVPAVPAVVPAVPMPAAPSAPGKKSLRPTKDLLADCRLNFISYGAFPRHDAGINGS